MAKKICCAFHVSSEVDAYAANPNQVNPISPVDEREYTGRQMCNAGSNASADNSSTLATRRLTLWLTKLQRQPRHRPQGPCALAALHPVVLWVPLRTYALARGTASSHLP